MEKYLLRNTNEKASPWLSGLLFLLIPVIGFLDYLTGPDIAFGLIYLLPVSVIAWLNSRFPMLLAAFLTVATWGVVDFLTARFPLNTFTYTWNFSSRLIVLLVAESLLSGIKQAHINVFEISRRDPLTNAFNSRGFKELAEHEIYRSIRSGQAISIAFLDVDNFKIINDTLGHTAGDMVLIKLVESIGRTVRKSDVVARIGGDEFVILLPETDQAAARIIVRKIEAVITEAVIVKNNPVTYSIGVLTCTEMPASVDAMIGLADKLMYTIKTSTKNNLAFSLYPDNPKRNKSGQTRQ